MEKNTQTIQENSITGTSDKFPSVDQPPSLCLPPSVMVNPLDYLALGSNLVSHHSLM